MESVVNEPNLTYGNYSYADYLKWTIQERFELIKGKVFKMSPAPSTAHQRASSELTYIFKSFLKGKKCEVFIAPFDVRFPKTSNENEQIFTVLQPDLCVVCDPSKIDDKGCIGAPDIVVEILSPGNNRKELDNKFHVYEEAGVKEYWLIHPLEKTFFRYIIDDKGNYQPQRLLTMGDIVTTNVLPGFELVLEDVFRERNDFS